jgi:hypothetical protein
MKSGHLPKTILSVLLMNTIAQCNRGIAAAEQREELSKLLNLPAPPMGALPKLQHGVLRLLAALLLLQYALLLRRHALLLLQYALLLRRYARLPRRYALLLRRYALLPLQYALLLRRYARLLRRYARLLRRHALLLRRHALLLRSGENRWGLLLSQDPNFFNPSLSRIIKWPTSVGDYIEYHYYS